MSEAILISIKPEWLRKILNGYKTVEIRKSAPKKITPPFTLYLYCSEKNRIRDADHRLELHYDDGRILPCNGFVVAKCRCTSIEEFWNVNQVPEQIMKQACLDKGELFHYVRDRKCAAWHIEDVEIFDSPKELSEFGLERAPQSYQFC